MNNYSYILKIILILIKQSQSKELVILFMFFLQKYKEIQHLGKGAYGEVYLVEDEKKQQYALKVISKHFLGDQFYVRQIVQGEIQCLKMMNSPNIIKLIQSFQTKDQFLLLLQYCDQGDLSNYMSTKKLKVLPLEQATKILADVIRGLQAMHNAGFLHRDLKPQNVLIKTQNGQQVAKLGDLGLSKRAENITGSYIGTQYFQSPEILGGEKYGFQVDMWAFGVFFYYLLNGQLLFSNSIIIPGQSFKPIMSGPQKKQYLELQAYGFSYKKRVQNSKFKIMWNCTAQMQDLFKRIFQLDSTKRITFSQLRQHAVFKRHFVEKSITSSKLYDKNRFNSKIKLPKAQILDQQAYNNHIQNAEIRMKIHLQYPDQSELLLRNKNQITFLNYCGDIFYKQKKFLGDSERLMICYYLKKYQLTLLRNYKNNLKKSNLVLRQPKYIWDKITKTLEFKQFKKTIKSQISRIKLQLLSLYDQCQQVKDSINIISKNFQAQFTQFVQQTEQPEQFKMNYRQSFDCVYKSLKKLLDQRKYQQKEDKQKIWFLLTLVVFCYSFYTIMIDKESLKVVFPQYFEEKGTNPEQFLFMDLLYWLQKKEYKLLSQKILAILNNYYKRD